MKLELSVKLLVRRKRLHASADSAIWLPKTAPMRGQNATTFRDFLVEKRSHMG